jgi:methylmalonyl-CoA mutase N-terminal domain/subunit
MPPILAAIEAYATLGEISDTLRAVFGEYTEAG